MLRASQAASRSMLAPLDRLGSRMPGPAMQQSGLSTAAAAISAPRTMTGRMAGVGAISAGQTLLAGARRYATTEVGHEGAYANLRQRTGEFSFPSRRMLPSRMFAEACRAGGKAGWRQTLFESSWGMYSGGYGLIGAGRAEYRFAAAAESRKSATRAAPKSCEIPQVADPPSLPHPTLGPALGVPFVYCTRSTRKSIDMQIKPEQRIKVQNPVVEVSPHLPLLHLHLGSFHHWRKLTPQCAPTDGR